ncbi:hypothetical protein [Demequina sediminicola]|uniref:hypothetical protein n=1 Tax=Demequina sediminicola TaxID=1095026 RepID=UPI0007866632|nr:hypothetical protein [Demequina sediminicola]
MFDSLGSALTFLVVLAAVVFVLAALAEGRLQHFLRFLLRQDRGRVTEHVYDEIPRAENDWNVLHGVDSIPDDVGGAERAKAWARDAYGQAKEVVETGREKWAEQRTAEPLARRNDTPTTGQISIGRH